MPSAWPLLGTRLRLLAKRQIRRCKTFLRLAPHRCSRRDLSLGELQGSAKPPWSPGGNGEGTLWLDQAAPEAPSNLSHLEIL